MSFFDSYERYYSLTLTISGTEYNNALSLIDAHDFAGAYYTFKNIQAYSDSAQRMASIVNLLGYTPENKTDNPKSVADFNATASPNSVALTWVDPLHVTEYKVSYRLPGQVSWDYTIWHNNHITWENLRPNTTYQFLIVAVISLYAVIC